jgi:PadR family transcriptional regulator, regulatory protein PadR
MSELGHIVYKYNRKTVLQKYKSGRKMFKASSQKEVSTKLMKGLLDLIILQLLSNQPMHGYEVITKIRKNFGVYFGPSTIYPLLSTLEMKGYVDSNWNVDFERPRKVYSLTTNGQNMLNYTEDSLNMIRNKITNNNLEIKQPTISMITTKSRNPLAIEVP